MTDSNKTFKGIFKNQQIQKMSILCRWYTKIPISPRVWYTKRAPKIIEITSFEWSRESPLEVTILLIDDTLEEYPGVLIGDQNKLVFLPPTIK